MSSSAWVIDDASTRKATGRLAGLVYLIMIVSAAAGYATMTRLVAGEPDAVLARLADSQAFRIVSLIPGIPAIRGELGVCLWLLIKGARMPESAAERG
jgi:hypothetical protein